MRPAPSLGWRPAFATFFLFLAVAVAATAFAADDNKIIFPGGTSGASAPAAPAGGGLGNIALVIGIALAAVGGWLVWRGRMSPPAGRDGRSLAIAETRSLGNRQYLVVASYEDKKFLLSVCPGRIELLAPLSGAAESGKPRS